MEKIMNKELLNTYKNFQETLSDLEGQLKAKQEQFDIENQEIKNEIALMKESISVLKNNIEEKALEEYNETKNKKLLGGIGIQERKVLVYDDEKALEWAKKTGTCLQLDKKKFEKVGLEMTDFVKESVNTKVTFPKEIKLED